ncbi:MAG: T9SS type A sorting domain-containing protein, partial [Bacteroidota bacterium]
FGFQIFPNPASNEINLHLNSIPVNCKIEIINLLGEKIISQAITASTTSINIQKLSIGIYFIKVSSDKFTEVKRVVKE